MEADGINLPQVYVETAAGKLIGSAGRWVRHVSNGYASRGLAVLLPTLVLLASRRRELGRDPHLLTH
jgi:hypothetical protein